MDDYLNNLSHHFNRFLKEQCADSHLFLGGKKTENKGFFSVYAPRARFVELLSKVQDAAIPMKKNDLGFWFCNTDHVDQFQKYQFVIHKEDGGKIEKADPFAIYSGFRPDRASILFDEIYTWNDYKWLEKRSNENHFARPMNIYEVHLGSWVREGDGFLNYKMLAEKLVSYVKKHHFTHIELLPIAGHPLDESWGYQVSSYFSVTSRFGNPNEFKWFVDYFHKNDIGIIIDWVGGHFPTDPFALAQFDGSYLFEHSDPLMGYQPKWNTLIFDYSKRFVKNFLLSNLRFWIENFHVDGVRFDAVSSMIYLDFEREEGKWKPNRQGSNENFDAIAFLQEANDYIHQHFPGVFTIAEEAYTYPGVTKSTKDGGLGFDYKWGLGWTSDTREFFHCPPDKRAQILEKLTFYLWYHTDERYQLTFSHDEIAHFSTLYGMMPGDEIDKEKNQLLYYLVMMGYPGKKLLFMGAEFGLKVPWDPNGSMVHEEKNPLLQEKVQQLFHLYKEHSALWENDYSNGFTWIVQDQNHPLISFVRFSKVESLLFVLNLRNQPYLYKFNKNELNTHQLLFSTNYERHCVETNSIFDIELAPYEGLIFEVEHIHDKK